MEILENNIYGIDEERHSQTCDSFENGKVIQHTGGISLHLYQSRNNKHHSSERIDFGLNMVFNKNCYL